MLYWAGRCEWRRLFWGPTRNARPEPKTGSAVRSRRVSAMSLPMHHRQPLSSLKKYIFFIRFSLTLIRFRTYQALNSPCRLCPHAHEWFSKCVRSAKFLSNRRLSQHLDSPFQRTGFHSQFWTFKINFLKNLLRLHAYVWIVLFDYQNWWTNPNLIPKGRILKKFTTMYVNKMGQILIQSNFWDNNCKVYMFFMNKDMFNSVCIPFHFELFHVLLP